MQRALGFANEKDHPEVAPSQFEMNYSYTEACVAADQVQLYKLICRQVAQQMDMTACFLPKPVTGVNGSGMHTNLSLTRGGSNLFWDPSGEDQLSATGWNFIDRILTSANDICLILNSSVNAYRRLDPHFEAPNQIKASAINRGAMVRIPLANEKSARDRGALDRPGRQPVPGHLRAAARPASRGRCPKDADNEIRRSRTRFLPDNIYDAIRLFKSSRFAMRAARRGRAGEVRRGQAGAGRPLPEGARLASSRPPRCSSTTR